MIQGGYIKLHRQITKWGWYQDANTARVFIHLLLETSFEPCEYKGIKLKRGQFVTSYRKLSKELAMSVNAIRTALKHLKKTGEISVEANHRHSVITVNNYNDYQHTDDTLTTHKRHTDGTPAAQHHNKKEKERTRRGRNGAPQISYDIEELEEINTLDGWEEKDCP